MAKSLELTSCEAGTILARQGEPADRAFVIQTGALAGKLVANKSDDAAIAAASPIEKWDTPGDFVGVSSILLGRYVETLVTSQPSELLVVPMTTDQLLKQFQKTPKAALGFGRALARKVKQANRNLTGAQSAVARLEQDLSRFYVDFYQLITAISKDAEGEDMILEALKNAKGSKTFSTGKALGGDAEENAVAMTRVIESYEMTGKQHKLKKAEALCRAGDPGNSMFVVVKGKLAVVIDGTKVGEINTGEMVGEIAVLLGESQTRTADLVAEDNTIVGIIPGDQFEKLAVVQPAMLISVLKTLIKRIDNNYTTMSDQGSKEKKTIARYLGKADVDLEGDYRELAEKLGNLIEEYEVPLYREVELLEQGAEKIAHMKDKYAAVIQEAAAAKPVAKPTKTR